MKKYINNLRKYADGVILCTDIIQEAINQLEEFDILVFPKGTYKVGSLFLKSHTTIVFDKDTKLIGSENIKDFTEIDTRIAGVEIKCQQQLLI